MNLINKINRLSKIPQLLNKKREAKEESDKKGKREKPEKDSGFIFDHDDAFIKKRPEETRPKPIVSIEKKTSDKEGVGNHIDVTI